MDWILETSPTFSYVFLRLGLAVTFFAHSTQQIFGWYGGRGWRGMIKNWNEKYHVPVAFGAMALSIEFFGAFSMLLGFLTRPFALGLAAFIANAMIMSHWGQRIFLGAQTGRGQRRGVRAGAFPYGDGAGRGRWRRTFRRLAAYALRKVEDGSTGSNGVMD